MKQGIIQMMFAVFACAQINAQPITLVLNSTNQFNYFDLSSYGGPVYYTNAVPGLFESSDDGVLFHTKYYRGGGHVITKSSYILAGGSAEYIWSGSGGSSFMQVVCGVMTQSWPTDTNNSVAGPIITEFGHTFSSPWLATPGRIYETALTFSTNSFFLTTSDYLTGQIMGTTSGNYDFTQPVHLYLRLGDTFDYLNAYLDLESLTLSLPPAPPKINYQPQSRPSKSVKTSLSLFPPMAVSL